MKYLYKKGYRYIARDIDNDIYAFGKKPSLAGGLWLCGDGNYIRLNSFDDLFDDVIAKETVLDIGAEVGTIDWNKIPVDTKVLVNDGGIEWYKRYFAGYNEGSEYPYKVFGIGTTSWSNDVTTSVTNWKYCRLAED